MATPSKWKQNGTVGDGGNVSNQPDVWQSSITAEGNGDVVLMTAVGNRAMDTLTVSASGLCRGKLHDGNRIFHVPACRQSCEIHWIK